MAVSRLRDEAQRLVGHVQSLHVQFRAELAAVSRLEEEVQVYKTEAALTQQKIAELKEKNSCDGARRTRRARRTWSSLCSAHAPMQSLGQRSGSFETYMIGLIGWEITFRIT